LVPPTSAPIKIFGISYLGKLLFCHGYARFERICSVREVKPLLHR
jgi:hypothetical protein